MAEKKTETVPPSWIAGDDPEGGIFVRLPEAVRTNCDVMRWLHHWLVDAMSDRGYVKWIEVLVESHLVELGPDIVDTTVILGWAPMEGLGLTLAANTSEETKPSGEIFNISAVVIGLNFLF